VEVYSQQSEKIYMVLLKKYPVLVNWKCVLLQQDNSRLHGEENSSKNWRTGRYWTATASGF
jgi:hypothetical protein